MVSLAALWLPILLSAVAVFVVSSVIHMVLRYHQNDFTPLPREDDLAAAIRAAGVPPGDYAMPYAGSTAAMKDPAFQEKMRTGPIVFMSVVEPSKAGFGSSLVQWFAYSILVGIIAGYIAGRALGPGAEYLDVFRLSGTAAFAAYSVALLQGSIWYKRKWSGTLKSFADGLIYALVTAGMFGWLWPS
jgi:Flp pilus assembly protein TadB